MFCNAQIFIKRARQGWVAGLGGLKGAHSIQKYGIAIRSYPKLKVILILN